MIYPPKRPAKPKHGEILAYYIVVYDRHIGRGILIPATRTDIIRRAVRLP